jgi:hypothetical protein
MTKPKKAYEMLTDEQGIEHSTQYMDKFTLGSHKVAEKTIKKALEAEAYLIKLKKEIFKLIGDFLEKMANEYKEDWKGNATLYSFDKSTKIEINIAERIDFDPRLNIAKAKIDKYLKDLTGEAPQQLRTLVMDAFQVDKKGKIDAKRIIALKRHKFPDQAWIDAMNIIHEAITIVSTRKYINFYLRENPTAEYRSICLNFSNINV